MTTLLRSLLAVAGMPNSLIDQVAIEGEDPVLPTPFPLGEAGAAALAAVGYAAAFLWCLQRDASQHVRVRGDEAAFAQRSHAYLKTLDQDTPQLWSPLSGFYQTVDNRWIQLHCNFPNHKQGVLETLGCADQKEAVEEAIARWSAQTLEQTLSAKGCCAAMVRSSEEWAATEQAKAIAQLPLFEVIKISESQPEPLPLGSMPLSGIRALDLTRVIAGPTSGKVWAQLGGTVMRIASPPLPFIEPLVMDTGHGKLSAHLDLHNEAERDTLYKLVKEADIFSQAYRPGAMDELGFSPETLAQLRPGLVYVSLSAYSHAGPWCHRHGYDSLVQSATGIAHEQTAGGPHPQHLPAQSLDYITGWLAAFGAMEALRRRAQEGGSYLVRVSLAQTAHWLQSLPRIDRDAYQKCHIPTEQDVAHLLTRSDSAFGRLQFMRPVLQMSDTPLFDAFPSVPLGTHLPQWPAG